MARGIISWCLVGIAGLAGCANHSPRQASTGAMCVMAPAAQLELGAGDALGQDLYITAVLIRAERELSFRTYAGVLQD